MVMNIHIYGTFEKESQWRVARIYREKVFKREENYIICKNGKHALNTTRGHSPCAGARGVRAHAWKPSYSAKNISKPHTTQSGQSANRFEFMRAE